MESKKLESECSRSVDDKSSDLQLYPVNDDEFVGVLNLLKLPSNTKAVRCETVIILDRSGSMGRNVEYITNTVLPAFFDRLAYSPGDKIHLITFDSEVEYFKVTVKSLGELQVRSRGCTSMSPAIKELHKLMDKFIKKKVEAVRIFTISDGEIDDPPLTKSLSDQLAKSLKKNEISINSQAVRFFTSTHGQPDTTALCCLLQLNNVTPSNLLDISSKEPLEIIVEKWVELFANDGLIDAVEMQCDCPVLRKNPWDTTSSDRIRLMVGKNVFWVKEIPNIAKINGIEVKITTKEPLTTEEFQELLDGKMKMIVDHVKILKIIQTDDGRETINSVVNYFKSVESRLASKRPKDEGSEPLRFASLASRSDKDDSPDNFCLASRAPPSKMRNNPNATDPQKFSRLLSNLANDDTIERLSSSQKADYLRNQNS